MISSANLNIEGALIQLALMIFFISGIVYTSIVGIYHSAKKIDKSAAYYIRSFFISAILTLVFTSLILCLIFL